MKKVLEVLAELVSESYTAASIDQDTLDERVFQTTILFYYKMKLYNINSMTQIELLYNNLRLSKHIESKVDLIELSYPLLWLTELGQKLLLNLLDTEEFEDMNTDEIMDRIIDQLVSVMTLHARSESLIKDPVYQSSFTEEEWTNLFKDNLWLLIGALIRFLPVTIFNDMLGSPLSESETEDDE